jgi:PKD repeat protein
MRFLKIFNNDKLTFLSIITSISIVLSPMTWIGMQSDILTVEEHIEGENDGVSNNHQVIKSRQSPIKIITFSNGEYFINMNLTNPTGPGGPYENSSAAVQIPKNAQIRSASIDIEGLSTPIIDNIIGTHNFTDNVNTSAYAGPVFVEPPPGPLQDLKIIYQFNTSLRFNISAWDNQNVTNSTQGNGSFAFHLFQFDLGSEQFGAINLTWVGHGVQFTDPTQYLSKLFYWNGTEFIFLAVLSGGGGADLNTSLILDNIDILDTGGNLHVIATSPIENETITAQIVTDFIEVTTLKNGSGLSYPYNLTIDAGNDGSDDLVLLGELNKKIDITNNLNQALQDIINASGDGYGDIIIPLNFISERPGIINISNLEITYMLDVRPELILDIPNSTEIYEDSGWSGSSIYLLDHFYDKFGVQNLSFIVIYKQDESEVNCIVNQSSNKLEFFTSGGFNGIRDFRLAAVNKGLDGVKSTGDDITTLSNMFHVTALPSNDPPDIYQLAFPNGHKRAITSSKANLVYSNERAVEDTPFSVVVKAFDPDGDTVSYSTNLTDGLGSDDLEHFSIDSTTGVINFYPTTEDVGILHFNITVLDQNGSVPLSDYLNVELWVEEVNDPPVINTKGPLIAYENRWNYFQIEAFDEEGADLIYRSTVPGGNFFEFSIERNTGLIAILPNWADTGVLLINVSVQEVNGSGGLGPGKISYRDLEIRLINENDRPRIITVGGMAAIKNDFLLIEADEDAWLNLTVTYEDEEGDSVSFVGTPQLPTTSLPENFDIDETDGTISYHPPQIDKDTNIHFYVNLTVSDGNATNSTDHVWLEFQVRNVNDPPVITDYDYDVQDGRVTVTLNVSDPNNDDLKFIWDYGDGSPKITSYNTKEGIHTYAKPGVYNVTITVVDSSNVSSSMKFQLNLTQKDFPEVPSPLSPQTKEEDNSIWLIAGVALFIINMIVLIIILFLFFRRRSAILTAKEKEEIKALIKAGPPTGRPPEERKELMEGEKRLELGPDASRPPQKRLPPAEEERPRFQTTLARFGEIFGGKKDRKD